MGSQTVDETRSPATTGPVLTISGLAILLAAGALYLTGASRAVAVWIAPVGLAAAVLGVVSLRGAAVPRRLLVALAIVVAVLVVVGVVTTIYAMSHQPTGA